VAAAVSRPAGSAQRHSPQGHAEIRRGWRPAVTTKPEYRPRALARPLSSGGTHEPSFLRGPHRRRRAGDRARPRRGPPLRDSAGISPDFAGSASALAVPAESRRQSTGSLASASSRRAGPPRVFLACQCPRAVKLRRAAPARHHRLNRCGPDASCWHRHWTRAGPAPSRGSRVRRVPQYDDRMRSVRRLA